ncbi:histidinol-phosphatase (PHP family) [Lachnospiraceae bacterium RM5]|nr:histidinol-phosphatase (PHP family) [Lachnospiraceae bacterium RM5]
MNYNFNNTLIDFHLHSFFSADSDESPENICKNAIDKGLSGICFTDHIDFDMVNEDNSRLFLFDPDEYFNTLLKLKELFKGSLDINIGVETGLEPDKRDRLNDFVNNHPFDFVIGSSHLINGIDPYYPKYFEGKTKKEALDEYFLSIITNLNTLSNFDVYGHLDYIIRYLPESMVDSGTKRYSVIDYIDYIDEILKKLINSGKGIEVNTCGYRAGLNNPNPDFDIIKRYKELGGEIITIGSDAHNAKDVGFMIKETKDILKKLGVNYITYFNNRKAEFMKI